MAETFDVFLSYNWRDADAVRGIANYLRQQGLKPFLDRWYLTPGQPWVPELERALAGCRAVAVFIGPHGLGPWQQREAHAALDRQSRTQGFPLIPVLLPGADPALGFLGQSTWVDLRPGVQDDFDLKLLLAGIRGQPPGPKLEERLASTRAAVCPYRGLLYFREEDAPFFFGREPAIGQLVAAVGRDPFLAVVGASGSGKSSVVRAGLVPALRCARDTVWEVATLFPGDQPVKALAAALIPFLEPDMAEVPRLRATRELADLFSERRGYLQDVVRRILEKQEGTQRLLLVADQWEELYTLTTDDAVRRRFMDELLEATERSPLTVVVTLRGDFVGKALAYRPLSDRLQGMQINLGPMTREELQRAIEQPASKVGLSLEPGLVQRILNDVGDEPGNLPLLEFVLKQLWDARRGAQLLNRPYDDMGRLQGAIAQRAEKFFGRLSLAEQEMLRRLFLQLIHETEDGQETRRRERLSSLPEAARPLVERLSGRGDPDRQQEPERLLVTARTAGTEEETVEVAHEALIRNWERLVNWLKADREFLLWRERLRALLEAFDPADPETLLRGPLLDEAERWFVQRAGDLSEAERKFIGASLEGRQQRREQEQRQQQRLKRFAIAAATLAALAAIAGLWAWGQQRRAEKSRRAADAQMAAVHWQLAQEARGVPFAAAISPVKAAHHFLKATAAAQVATDRAGAVNAAWTAQIVGRRLLATLLHSGAVRGLTNSPDRKLILTWSGDGTARLWQAADGQPVGAPMKHKKWVNGAVFSTDGQRILSWSEDGTARLWQAVDGQPVGTPMKHKWGVQGAVFSADGQRILSWDGNGIIHEGEARLWQAADGQPVGNPMKHEGRWGGAVLGAVFSADGQRILSWSDDGTARLWQAADGQPVGAPMKHEGVNRPVFSVNGLVFSVNGPMFSADGQRILSRSFDTVRLWQAADGQPVGAPMKHEALVQGAVFSADGQRILSRSEDGTVRLWNVADGQPVGAPMKHEGTVSGVVFSADGQRILSWGYDSTARLWQAANGQPVGAPMKHNASVSGAVFSARGQGILSWSEDGTVRLWRAVDGQPFGAPMKHEAPVHGAVFSADGQRILSWTYDEVRLWNVADGQPVGAPMKHEARVHGAVFSADGQRILSWSEDGTARLWQVADCQSAGTPMKHEKEVNGAVFSADGQRILSWSEDGTARLWQAADGQPVGAPMKHKGLFRGRVLGAVFSADGQRILSWSEDGMARLWQAADGQPVGALIQHQASVNGPLFSADGQRILSWNKDDTVRLWNVADGQPVGTPMKHKGGVSGAVFSTDGQRILSWGRDGTARLWQATDGQPVGAPMKHEKQVEGAVFSADGQRILSWSADGTARLWQAAGGQPVGAPMKHENGVSGAVFSTDGQRILSWSEDRTARLWQAAGGQPVGAPMKHENGVSGAVFSTDGQRILSWSEDGTVRLWSGANGQSVGAPMKHEKMVVGAVFSANGQRILSWSEDGTARLWSGENSQLMALFRHGDAVNSACFDKQEQRILTASKDGSVGLWDISFDASIPIEERVVEFEVRSATTLAPNAEVRVLTESEWAARKQRLAELRRKRGAK